MSEYNKLREKGINRGRPRHSPEQRAASQLRNSLRQEARRRAHLVLKSRHFDEFNDIYENEMNDLIKQATASESPKSKKSNKS